MRRFTTAVERAVTAENWFAALFIALALPDICGSLEDPKAGVGARYKKWFSQYLSTHYGDMLSAEECYYFRCKCLHQGLATYDATTGQRIHFTPPIPRAYIHGNYVNGALQLQIDLFCLEMCSAVHAWENNVRANAAVQSRIQDLIVIHGSLI